MLSSFLSIDRTVWSLSEVSHEIHWASSRIDFTVLTHQFNPPRACSTRTTYSSLCLIHRWCHRLNSMLLNPSGYFSWYFQSLVTEMLWTSESSLIVKPNSLMSSSICSFKFKYLYLSSFSDPLLTNLTILEISQRTHFWSLIRSTGAWYYHHLGITYQYQMLNYFIWYLELLISCSSGVKSSMMCFKGYDLGNSFNSSYGSLSSLMKSTSLNGLAMLENTLVYIGSFPPLCFLGILN